VLAVAIHVDPELTTALFKAVAAAEGDLRPQSGIHLGDAGGIEGVGAVGIRIFSAIKGVGAVGGPLTEIRETAAPADQVVDAADHAVDGDGLLGIGAVHHRVVESAHGHPLEGSSFGSGGQVKDEEIPKDNVNLRAQIVQQIEVAVDVFGVVRGVREQRAIAVVAGIRSLDDLGLRCGRRWGPHADTPTDEGGDKGGENSHGSLGQGGMRDGHGGANGTKEPGKNIAGAASKKSPQIEANR